MMEDQEKVIKRRACLMFLPTWVFAAYFFCYNLYRLYSGKDMTSMGQMITIVAAIATVIAAVITGFFTLRSAKEQRKYQDLLDALGNVRDAGPLTEQNRRMQVLLTEQNRRMRYSLTEQNQQLKTTLTEQNQQLKTTLTEQNQQLAGDTGEWGNLTAQHKRIIEKVGVLTKQAEENARRNANLSDDARKISEAIHTLNAFEELLGKQALELVTCRQEIQELKSENLRLREQLLSPPSDKEKELTETKGASGEQRESEKKTRTKNRKGR